MGKWLVGFYVGWEPHAEKLTPPFWPSKKILKFGKSKLQLTLYHSPLFMLLRCFQDNLKAILLPRST